MSDHIYAQSEIFAVVRQLLKKYHAEKCDSVRLLCNL